MLHVIVADVRSCIGRSWSDKYSFAERTVIAV